MEDPKRTSGYFPREDRSTNLLVDVCVEDVFLGSSPQETVGITVSYQYSRSGKDVTGQVRLHESGLQSRERPSLDKGVRQRK